MDYALLLFEEQCGATLDPLVLISSAGQLDVSDHTHSLRTRIHRQPHTLLWGITTWNTLKHTHNLLSYLCGSALAPILL